MAAVHNSPYAGSWYPGRAKELAALAGELFEASRRRTGDDLLPDARAFVVPHAGLRYSGTVAAAAYRHICRQKPERILVLAFSHRDGPAGVVMPEAERIAVPNGEVRVDFAGLPFPRVPEHQVCDHSVEIQLPLLVEAAPGVPVTPLYVGLMSEAERERAAEALTSLVAPGTILLASSDFTHYGRSFAYQPFPVDEDTPHRLRELDEGAMEAASSLDVRLFFDYLRATGATVCGYNPIALLLRTLALAGDGDFYQQTLDYQTSGDITGDFHQSVSYAALGYFPRRVFELDTAEQELLLQSARQTLDHLFATGERKPVLSSGATPRLARAAGVFVSLHEGGELRGCIGHRVGNRALAAAVPELTLSAALDDPRFEPLRSATGHVEIEISVLTPMRRIRDANGFRLGRHGVYFSREPYRGLLLPQVAEDREWTREQFLDAVCRKAGLGSHAWRDNKARLYVFEAQVFGK